MRPSRLTSSLAAIIAFAAHAEAPSPSGATYPVRETLAQVGAVMLSDQSDEQKRAALRELARKLLDTHEMGRRAIGAPLDEQPAPEQDEFLNLFDDVIVRSYVTKLLFFRQPRFAFGNEEARGDAVVVHTQIVTDNDKFRVDYVMHRRNDGWMASDIVIEGVALT